MPKDPILTRIRKGAAAMMLAISVYLIWYAWRSFGRALRFCLTEPERWETHWAVDEGSVIGTGLRLFHFTNWSIIILVSIASGLSTIWLMNAFRKGELFSETVARRIIWVGVLLLVVQITDAMFDAVTLWTISYGNADGPEPIWWYYNAGTLKQAMLGGIVLLFGAMMQRAIEVDRENKGFV